MSGRKATSDRSDVNPDIAANPEPVLSGDVKGDIPGQPKFRMSEGTREELERTGKATCPFTGRALTRDDL